MDKLELELIEKVKNGNRSAFAQLYHKYYKLIRYIIYNIVKDDDLTADLSSISFIKAYERIDKFVDTISFEAWLKTIAINTTIDYLRQAKDKYKNVSIDDPDNTINNKISDYNSPETELIHSEDIRLLKIALSKLRPKYRILLTLRYFDNLSYFELSERLGIPIGTIKSNINKAKKRLKQIFTNL